MNKHRNCSAEEVVVIVMASDSSDEKVVFDVAENELISDEDIDYVVIATCEDDFLVSSKS